MLSMPMFFTMCTSSSSDRVTPEGVSPRKRSRCRSRARSFFSAFFCFLKALPDTELCKMYGFINILDSCYFSERVWSLLVGVAWAWHRSREVQKLAIQFRFQTRVRIHPTRWLTRSSRRSRWTQGAPEWWFRQGRSECRWASPRWALGSIRSANRHRISDWWLQWSWIS